ncbi:hypothetical protein [Sphingomonas jatrophae]|uniref:Uncharacterized protein n=1 Tax=Sphingomonas jatrophae TaxID=1166337 RepID=A0A1I6K0L5_9SPHN|nr:hypothetical protein [Sphingomonas jatrophae]SFR84756.1 hypothetical protein SAMN05192580_1174 [Sphingomonas jatrophae]
MQLIDTTAALARALVSPLAPNIKRLLTLRRTQLGTIEGAARFIVVEPGDTVADVERALAFPLADEGEPCFDWAADHDGLFEAAFNLSDDSAADVMLVPDTDGIDSDLLALCRFHATTPLTP